MRFPLAICASGSDQQCPWRECQKCFPSAKNAGKPLDSIPECVKRPASGIPGPAPSSCLFCKELSMPGFLSVSQHLPLPPFPSSSTPANTSPQTCLCLSGGILRACNLQHRLKVEANHYLAAVTKLLPAEWHCLCQSWALCPQLDIY